MWTQAEVALVAAPVRASRLRFAVSALPSVELEADLKALAVEGEDIAVVVPLALVFPRVLLVGLLPLGLRARRLFLFGDSRSGADSTGESELNPQATDLFRAKRSVLGVTTSLVQKSCSRTASAKTAAQELAGVYPCRGSSSQSTSEPLHVFGAHAGICTVYDAQTCGTETVVERLYVLHIGFEPFGTCHL